MAPLNFKIQNTYQILRLNFGMVTKCFCWLSLISSRLFSTANILGLVPPQINVNNPPSKPVIIPQWWRWYLSQPFTSLLLLVNSIHRGSWRPSVGQKLPKLVRSRASLGQAQTLYAEAPHPTWQTKLKYQPTGKSWPLALILSNMPESRYNRLVNENRWHYCETDPALTRPHFYLCKLPRLIREERLLILHRMQQWFTSSPSDHQKIRFAVLSQLTKVWLFRSNCIVKIGLNIPFGMLTDCCLPTGE